MKLIKPMPLRFIPVELCSVGEPPLGEHWLHEIKWDGYRIEAIIDEGHVQLLSRNQKDWTNKFSAIAKGLETFPATRAILDGEVVVLDDQGISRFQLLQNSLEKKEKPAELYYYVIDIMYYENEFVLNTPLIERKKLIKKIFNRWRQKSKKILVSDFIKGDGQEVFLEACRRGLEGIISKRENSIYRSKRTSDWIKVKCFYEQEFIIGGFTDPKGRRTGFGALALGYYEDNRLIYCGNVGTGFSEDTLKKLYGLLKAKEQKKCPFVDDPPAKLHYVKPDLVAEIRFTEWTNDQILRQPVFLGLRLDISAKEVTKDKAISRKKSVQKNRKSLKSGVIITHPDKKLYEQPPITKQNLADFYEAINEWILPHIINRPLSLFRCPNGIDEKGFFQKHIVGTLPDGIYSIKTPVEDEPYVMIKDLQGLIGLVQIAALEIHPWNSKKGSLSKPDRIIFDLDPGDNVDFKDVRSAARELRDVLSSMSLESFLKTTGGIGLHVVVPVIPQFSHREVTEFAKGVAEVLVRKSPEKFLLTMKKTLRAGKIFIDYLRNPQGSTAIAPYSLRARRGAPIATPIRWDELSRLNSPAQFTFENLLMRFKRLLADPWEGFFSIKQKMPKIK